VSSVYSLTWTKLISRYELKTASRLYVLEPHRAPVSSVTFSPDGRRLLTVSLEEGVVTVWKVGSSLSGFFNVGGPPRQGGLGGSGPFKRIEFARVEDGTSYVLYRI
jgi:WD40 repeat protein